MNNRGMTYIEVLIAAMLLGILITPVLSGFYNAAQNQRYAHISYEASLYAVNLLTEAGTGEFASVFNHPAFATEYRTGEYDYCLYVYEPRPDGIHLEFFTSTDSGLTPNTIAPIFNGDVLPQSTARQITVSTDAFITLNGDTDIFIDGDHIINLGFENIYGNHILLNIYTAYPERISIECSGEDPGKTTVWVHRSKSVERIIVAEVYDKQRTLLNRAATPIVFERSWHE